MESERGRLFNELLEIEDDLDLFDETIDGVYFWERIRKKVYDRIHQQVAEESKSSSSPLPKRTEYYRALRNVGTNIFFKNPYLESEKDVLVFGYERRKKLSDGYWWDIIADPLLEELKMDWVLYEKPRLHEHKKPPKTEHIRYWDLIHYYPKFLDEFNISELYLTRDERNLLERLEQDIESRFDARVDVTDLTSTILFKRRHRLPQYKKILRKVDPKVVLLAKSGRFTFIEACREMGIPTVKLQTALRSAYNPKYSYPGDDRVHRTFADYVFVWGQETKDRIPYPVPEENIRVVGFPFLEMQKRKYANTQTKDQVLFISQPTIGERLSKFAVELQQSITDECLNIVYKLHPSENANWESTYPWLKNSGIEVVPPGGTPLYKLLTESSDVIGVDSTVLYEATNFDNSIYIVEPANLERLSSLLDANYATVVNSPSDVISGRKSCNDRSNRDSSYFFQTSSFENIVHELCLIKN